MRTATLTDQPRIRTERALDPPLSADDPNHAAASARVIGDGPSLRHWRRELRLLGPRPDPVPVLFQLPQLTPEQNLSTTTLAREYQQACGCASGSVFMSVATVGAIAVFFAGGGEVIALRAAHVLSLGGIAALSAVSGRLLGLLWARWQLMRIAEEVEDVMRDSGQPRSGGRNRGGVDRRAGAGP